MSETKALEELFEICYEKLDGEKYALYVVMAKSELASLHTELDEMREQAYRAFWNRNDTYRILDDILKKYPGGEK
jgi:hypothetical protein